MAIDQGILRWGDKSYIKILRIPRIIWWNEIKLLTRNRVPLEDLNQSPVLPSAVNTSAATATTTTTITYLNDNNP